MKEKLNRMRRLRLLAVTAIVALAAPACAGTSMSSELGDRYAVTVVNEMDQPLVVSLDDGSGSRLLGTVAPDRDERFVLYGMSATTVTLVARDQGDTLTIRRTVTLRQGESVEVRLSQG